MAVSIRQWSRLTLLVAVVTSTALLFAPTYSTASCGAVANSPEICTTRPRVDTRARGNRRGRDSRYPRVGRDRARDIQQARCGDNRCGRSFGPDPAGGRVLRTSSFFRPPLCPGSQWHQDRSEHALPPETEPRRRRPTRMANCPAQSGDGGRNTTASPRGLQCVQDSPARSARGGQVEG